MREREYTGIVAAISRLIQVGKSRALELVRFRLDAPGNRSSAEPTVARCSRLALMQGMLRPLAAPLIGLLLRLNARVRRLSWLVSFRPPDCRFSASPLFGIPASDTPSASESPWCTALGRCGKRLARDTPEILGCQARISGSPGVLLTVAASSGCSHRIAQRRQEVSLLTAVHCLEQFGGHGGLEEQSSVPVRREIRNLGELHLHHKGVRTVRRPLFGIMTSPAASRGRSATCLHRRKSILLRSWRA